MSSSPPAPLTLEGAILPAWRTNHRVTAYLIRTLPAGLWSEPLPLLPARTFRSVAAHLHNSRAIWIRRLGEENGIKAPAQVDHRSVTRAQLLAALRRSTKGMEALFRRACREGGRLPPTKAYVWRNLPLEVGHMLAYFTAHEAHHRGQLIMAARQAGHRLSASDAGGVWQFRTRMKEKD